MGKETKIGLALIGVLLTVFGVLLFRHLGAGQSLTPIEDDTEMAVRPLSAEGMSAPQNVVVTGGEPVSDDTRQALWDSPEPSAETSGEQPPAASYMPEGAPPAKVAEDPYAEPLDSATEPAAAQANDRAAPVSATSPFQHDRYATDEQAQPMAADAGTEPRELPDSSDAPPRRNPLRRLSAELPLDDAEGSAAGEADVAPAYDADPGVDWGQTPTDRYGAPEPVDPFGSPEGAEEPRFGANDDAGQAELPQYDALPTAEQPPSDEFAQEGVPADAPAAQSDPFGTAPPPADDWRTDDWQAGDAGRQSATAPQPVVAPQAVSPPVITNGKYTVQPGDTLWSISEKVYGTGGYFKALAAHNRAGLPRSDQLTVGGQVAVPSTDQLERDYPSLCPKQRKSALVQPRTTPRAAAQRRSGSDVYVVAEGDTLFDIARYELGRAARWSEIYQLNRDVLGEDFDYLRPGTELVMPPRSRPAAEVSQAGGSRYQ